MSFVRSFETISNATTRSNVREGGSLVGGQRGIRYLGRKGTLCSLAPLTRQRDRKRIVRDSIGHAPGDYRYRRRSLSRDRRNGRRILFQTPIFSTFFSANERSIALNGSRSIRQRAIFRTFVSLRSSSFQRFLISQSQDEPRRSMKRERERERVASLFFFQRIVSPRISSYIYIATFVPSFERKTWSDKRPMGKISKVGRNFLFAFTFRAKDVLYSFFSHRLSISFDIFVFFLSLYTVFFCFSPYLLQMHHLLITFLVLSSLVVFEKSFKELKASTNSMLLPATYNTDRIEIDLFSSSANLKGISLSINMRARYYYFIFVPDRNL